MNNEEIESKEETLGKELPFPTTQAEMTEYKSNHTFIDGKWYMGKDKKMVEPIKREGPKESVVPKDDMVILTREELQEMKDSMKALRKEQSVLMQTADKKALALHYQRNKEELPKEVTLRTINGKVIIGWRSMVDEGSFKDSKSNNWGEKQVIEVLFEDAETSMMALVDFYRQYRNVVCRVSGESYDENQNLMLKVVRLDNDKEYEVGVQFVN